MNKNRSTIMIMAMGLASYRRYKELQRAQLLKKLSDNKVFSFRDSGEFHVYKNKYHTLIIDQVEENGTFATSQFSFEGNVQSVGKKTYLETQLLKQELFFS